MHRRPAGPWRARGLLLAFILTTCPAASIAAEGRADQVEMQNGDRLSGQVVKAAGGILHFETSYAGVVEIDLAQVASFETAGAVVVELADGQRVEGTLTADGAELRISSARSGTPLGFELSELLAINPPDPTRSRIALSLGANSQSGNTSRTSIALGAEGEHETARGKFSAGLRYSEAEESGERTAGSTYGELKYELKLTDRRYLYAKVNLLADDFKDLDLRTVAGLGYGYQAIENDRLSLDLEAGAVYLSENFIVNPDQAETSVDVGAKAEWQLGRWGTLSESLTVRPSFDESSYQLRFENTLRSRLALGWSLMLRNVFDYDSEPPPGFEKDDLLWIAGLELTLE